MDSLIETDRKSGKVHFVSITLSDTDIPYPISSQGFLDRARNTYDLTYLSINVNEHGKGYGRRAMVKLASMFDEVHVYGSEPQAVKFWLRMYEEKLIASLHWNFLHLPKRLQDMYNSLMG